MRYNEITKEAERNTLSAKEIQQTLTKAGYKRLGTGADATVWSKDAGKVIKIIMPDEDVDRSESADIFYKFYEFVQQYQQYENLPRFIDIGGKHHTTFNIGDKEYIQIAMEQLYPLAEGSIEEAVVWVLSDFATKNLKWEVVYEKILYPDSWLYWSEPPSVEDILDNIQSWSKLEIAKWGIFYSLMQILYRTGKINKFYWDLHTSNVMQRQDGTLVIIDPWFGAMESRA
jgi:hypothetical protein